MKAYVLRDIGRFGIEEVERPVPGPDEVIVQVKAAGICGSDIPRIYYHGTYSYPLIPGHEYSGIVVEAESTAVKEADVQEDSCNAGEDIYVGQAASWIGKRVGVFPLIPCGKCLPCRQKRYEMCRNYSYLGSRRDGGFAEYVSVPVWNLIELPEEVTFEQAAMMEPMAVAVHAMRKVLQDKLMHTGNMPQIRIAICGLGTIGLFLLMFLKEAGYEDILVIGNKDIQKEKAFALGISGEQYYDSRDGGAGAWLEQCAREKGIDVFFECVGVNETVNLAVNHTAPGGRVMLVGNPASDMVLDRQIYWKILRNQLTLFGTWNSSYSKPFYNKGADRQPAASCLSCDDQILEDDWQYVLNRLAAGRVHPEQMITHRYDFDGLIKGFELMRGKTEEYLKIMLQRI
ncbi:MAG: galactitol-1-phosphate 5-dehydrogenase [Lachnospiraceae bacterium]|nr:galactitol-1-phosphate 5-dehydrogenase [Lachnospiraceae bacterium]